MKGKSAGAPLNDFEMTLHRLIIVCKGRSKGDEIQMTTMAH